MEEAGMHYLLLKQILFMRYCLFFLKKKIKKICIWRPSGIGDIIMLHPLAKSLKEKFPNASITYVSRDRAVNLEVAGRIPSFDHIGVNKDGTRFSDFKKRNGRNFDITILPYYETVFNRFLNKIGKGRNFIASLYSSVGLECPPDIRLVYRLKDEEEQFALEYKKRLGNYIILIDKSSPFTSKRDWPYEYWQKLINLQTLPVILIGTSKDTFEGCIDLRNKITIHQCAALIKECRLFVGVDTGPFWFTNVFNKDAVIINGGFQPPVLSRHPRSHHFFSNIECAPCLKWDEICPHDMKCMKIIKPEDVNVKIKEILASSS